MEPLYHSVSGHGPNLVLLHGWGMHSGIWYSILPELEKHFTVHLIDLPGHGHSPHYEDYAFENWVSSIIENIPKSSTLMGWSLGGLIALYLARQYPEKIDSVITVGSSPYFVRSDNWPGMRIEAMHEFHQELHRNPEKTLKYFFQLQLFNQENNRELVKQVNDNIFSLPLADPRALEAGLDILENLDLRQELKLLQQPCLHLFGRLDKIAPVELAAHIPDVAPGHQIEVFSKAAHMPFLSDQTEFLQRIMKFYDQNSQRK